MKYMLKLIAHVNGKQLGLVRIKSLNSLGRTRSLLITSKKHYVTNCTIFQDRKLTARLLNSSFISRLNSNSTTGNTKLTPFILPDIGEGIKEVKIREWMVKEGDNVKEFDPICEVESDKATATITSRFEGTISAIHYEVGANARVGKPLVDIMVANAMSSTSSLSKSEDVSKHSEAAKDKSNIEKETQTISTSHETNMMQMLPSVRRLARLEGVDLDKLQPTGKNGRLLKEDVLNYLDKRKQVNSQTETHDVHENDPKDMHRSRLLDQQLETIVPLNGIKQAMFKTMTKSLTIPHFNYSDEIDMTNLVGLINKRNLKKSVNGKEPAKVSNLAVIIKMISMSLLEYPELNGSLIGDSGEEFMIKHYHNIGVAIDTPFGLVVPNIKNVQSLSIQQINDELSRLRKLAYDFKLGPADLTGGTITLSNIGAIGGIFGVPVIVKPEILIVALGKIRKLPRFNEDSVVEARDIMQAVWSADHRCVDGATLSRFSNLIKDYIENPESALLKMY